jgi:hypothetical protein
MGTSPSSAAFYFRTPPIDPLLSFSGRAVRPVRRPLRFASCFAADQPVLPWPGVRAGILTLSQDAEIRLSPNLGEKASALTLARQR